MTQAKYFFTHGLLPVLLLLTVAASAVAQEWTYYELGCTDEEWNGYFAPSNWRVIAENGQEIPAAEQYFSASDTKGENTNGIILKGARKQMMRWAIEVPATGFLSFRFGSNEEWEGDTIIFSVNDRQERLNAQADGIYYSPFLRPGDVFSIHIPSGSEPIAWKQLFFHTNARGVVVYPEATRTNRRYRPIKEGQLQRVEFPDRRFGSWPTFDYDGMEDTTEDRMQLRRSTDLFEVNFSDSIVFKDDNYLVERTFRIKEKCALGNTIVHTVEWHPLPLLREIGK